MTSAILCLFWTFVSLAILAAGYLHAYGFKSSQIFNDILLFGKLHDTQRKRTVIQYIEVPKRFVTYYRPQHVGNWLLNRLQVNINTFI